jgi:hypothetical protein
LISRRIRIKPAPERQQEIGFFRGFPHFVH